MPCRDPGADHVSRTARLAVAAWVMAADGDDRRLAAFAQPEAADRLMRPGKTWRVAPAHSATDGETIFVGMLDLTLAGSGPCPWQLSSGHVQTLDEFLGYVFTSRGETPEEYRRRTGSTASPALARSSVHSTSLLDADHRVQTRDVTNPTRPPDPQS